MVRLHGKKKSQFVRTYVTTYFHYKCIRPRTVFCIESESSSNQSRKKSGANLFIFFSLFLQHFLLYLFMLFRRLTLIGIQKSKLVATCEQKKEEEKSCIINEVTYVCVARAYRLRDDDEWHDFVSVYSIQLSLSFFLFLFVHFFLFYEQTVKNKLVLLFFTSPFRMGGDSDGDDDDDGVL